MVAEAGAGLGAITMLLIPFIRKAGFSTSVDLSKLKFGSIPITPDIETFYLVATISTRFKLIGPKRFHPGSHRPRIYRQVFGCVVTCRLGSV